MKNQLYNELTMGEGNTPLIRLFKPEKKFGWQGQIWAKCEYQNPTGSFKDRGSVAEIREALKRKKSGVVCASTGNMAASLSAYAARAELPCYVIVPMQTPKEKLRQSLMYGAKITEIKGNYDDCVIETVRLAEKTNALLCGDYATRRKGQQTIGTELAKSQVNFNAFVVPVGNGTLGCAITEGFSIQNQSPAFIGVQGRGADPLYEAWMFDKTIDPLTNPSTIASAMNVGNPLDGYLTLELLNKTKGQLISVSDQQLLSSQMTLAQTEGIFVETTAAATIAALRCMKNKSLTLVLILTGSGLKENSKGGDDYV